MEIAVESAADHQSIDSIKLNDATDKQPTAEDVCVHKSNGVTESASAVPDSSEGNEQTELVEASEADCNVDAGAIIDGEEASEIVSTSETPAIQEDCNVNIGTEVVIAESTKGNEAITSELTVNVADTSEAVDSNDSEYKDCHLNNVEMEEIVESEVVEPSNDNVRFETEILVETNVNDVNEVELQVTKTDNESQNNILSDLGQNIELSEVLRSSDVAENAENNNCTIRQEVFNKEELLDILEGNDVLPPNQVVDICHNVGGEAQLALEQISRLKSYRKSRSSSGRDTSKLSSNKEGSHKDRNNKDHTKKEYSHKEVSNKEGSSKESSSKESPIKESAKKEENIVCALVKDWDDDEPAEEQQSQANDLLKSDQENESVIKEEGTADSSTDDCQIAKLDKSSDDGQPQRRLGRVIKKKVIFDPDNPDTFTKSKTLKNKDTESDKDQHQPKKPKLEQISLRAKSKSPVSKMQWKKPPPKNNKQNKRLTEVDKLLMDEGAVNMIYQLTPEAPKGKKNMKTKAEFIKKLQSSTPEGKEMKFRERKKESLKGEEGEAKRILGGKQRSSLSSSVKSPAVSEDFETHSADDSIIYRRHSSSSYSSSCMSPRRLSDVEGSQSAVNTTQPTKELADVSGGDTEPASDVFQPDSSITTDIINKDDCLSIKKKLNSKLSLALNKRKRESGKTDKVIKKKILKVDEAQGKRELDQFKFLSLTFDQRVAEICIRKSGTQYNVEVLKEIDKALSYVDTRRDVSVTLLTSECGALCSDLDLTSLLDDDVEKRTQSAEQIAESMRSMLACAMRHGKLVCCGVWAACAGAGLALAALADVALAAERAAFRLRAPAPAAVAALRARRLPPNVINDMIIFGRELSASEALQHGLVSRVLWPGGVSDQIRAIVKDISNQSPQELLLKKKLLKLGQTPESTFLLQLEAEAALMVDYWTSDEGQKALRSSTDAV